MQGVSIAHMDCELGAKTKHVAGMAISAGKPSWAHELISAGLTCYGGIVKNVDVLEEHRRDTYCTFGTRSSKKFGSLTINSCQQTESETPSSALSSIQQDERKMLTLRNYMNINIL